MIQAFSFSEDLSSGSNSDLVFRGRDFFFQGNSYDDSDATPPAIYTEGDVVCEGEIFTSGLTFRINDGLDGGSLIWEDYNHMLHVTSACSVETADYGDGPSGISFSINTYRSDPWTGAQEGTYTYTFDNYGDFYTPGTIFSSRLQLDSGIQVSGYNDSYEGSGQGIVDISPGYIGMTSTIDNWPMYEADDMSITTSGLSIHHTETNNDSSESRSSSVNLNRDGLTIDGGSYSGDAVDAISLTIDNGLSLDSYGDMLSLLAGGGLSQTRTTGSYLTLNANGGLYLYDSGSYIYLQAGTGLTSEGSDGSCTYFGVSGIGHYAYDENHNRIGADLNSSDFATLREMIDEYNASKGA
jgi:hypothetical protein